VNETASKPWRALSWPNRISLLRLLLIWPFTVLLLNGPQWPWARHAALAIFVVMAVSDMVDGMLARRLNAKTRLGAILDPLADKALIICSVVLLSRRSAAADGMGLPNWVVVAVVGKDLWVVIGCLVVFLVTDRLRVQPTRAGKVCTFAQLVMVGYTLMAPDLERLATGLGSWGILLAGWAVAVLSVAAIISYTRLGLSFTIAEGKPLEDNGREKQEP
jgi:cardiolipin synthase